MNIRISFFLFSWVAILFSCSNDESESHSSDATVKPLYKDEQVYEDKIVAIENDTSLYVLKSLAYNNNDGSTEEAAAYLDEAENEVKIEEYFSDHESGNYGKRFFFVEKGKMFASKEIYFDNQLKNPSFVERVSYYDKKGKVLFTKIRKSFYEEDLDEQIFEVAKKYKCPIDNAMNMLNQEGKFVSTFQGFVKNEGILYLLVGENKPNGYTAALVVQYADKVIRELQRNEKELIGSPLDIQYEVGSDINNLTYRVLLSATFNNLN
jgi:hypothetical protein